ncbi:serine/threonine-protein phosphatase 7 long form homolog [Arachis stenosperma]|uniref:serine/threonine-protein phosphatase 7 long form homolog n=1 Tax=Arachis stenosperma TaxID=217475 RepID=UPI0025AD5325|nr:serine/threonine-protein phosphatase 7 long form homolog [Arachis stenosperma]
MAAFGLRDIDTVVHGDTCLLFGLRPRLLPFRRVTHTLPPIDAIIPYLAEAGFGDTVLLRNFTFDNSFISAIVERYCPETHTFHLPWGEMETWALVEQLLGARPPVAAQQAAQRKESFTLKYLMTDKSNNLVHLRWLPLLQNFEEYRAFLWGSTVLAWTYRSLCSATQQGVTDIAAAFRF